MIDRELVSTLSLTEVIEMMHQKRQALDVAKAAVSILQDDFDTLAKSIVPEAMENAGMEQVVVAGIGRVNLRADIYTSIPAEMKQEAYQWLSDNGREGLITQTVNASTLKAGIREAIKKGEEFPEDLFKVTPYTMAVITKKV